MLHKNKISSGSGVAQLPSTSATQDTLSGLILLGQWENTLTTCAPHNLRQRDKNLLFPTCNLSHVPAEHIHVYMKMYVSAGIYLSKIKTRRNTTLLSLLKGEWGKWSNFPRAEVFWHLQRRDMALAKFSKGQFSNECSKVQLVLNLLVKHLHCKVKICHVQVELCIQHLLCSWEFPPKMSLTSYTHHACDSNLTHFTVITIFGDLMFSLPLAHKPF